MRYELRIALRYLKPREEALPSLTSVIAIGGVALGVFALIVVLAVMSGLEEDLRGKILGASAHIVVEHPAGLATPEDPELLKAVEAIPGVVGASPFVFAKAMIRSGSYTDGVVLRGVDPARAAGVTAIRSQIREGSWEELGKPSESPIPDEPAVAGIVLGEGLASNLRVFVGERVQLLIPGAVSTPMGRKPRVRTFQVVGIFRTEFFDYDSSWAYTSLAGAQDLLKLGSQISGIELRVRDPFEAPAVARQVATHLEHGLEAKDWRQLNSTFFSALQLEKWAMFLILCLIITVAAFNIVSILMMKVMEKTRDIGILKAIGASERSILRVFLYEGATIGVTGTLLGFTLGVVLCWAADRYELIPAPAEIYNINHFPFRMEAFDLISIVVASLLISLLTTLYPSYRAARLDPVEAIRAD